MSLFFNLLDEEQKRLTEKGYDEQSLNSPDKPGWLFSQLRSNLSMAVRDSLVENGPFTFELRAVGFFNDDKDFVIFNLHYRADFEQGTLSVYKLEMEYNKRTLTLELADPSQLPHSSQAISIFNKPQLLVRPVRTQPDPGTQKQNRPSHR